MKKRYGMIILAVLVVVFFIGNKLTPPNRQPTNENQVVIVTGAEPEGIAAAVGAARSGAKVYLLNKEPILGGLFTSGMMSALDVNYKTRLPIFRLNDAYFGEFYKAAGNGFNFDIKKAQTFFEDTITSENITHISNIEEWQPIMEGNEVVGVTYLLNNKIEKLKADIVIDSSNDAEIARAAGATYRLGREELGLKNSFAASTLVFSLKGVDWEQVKSYLKEDNNKGTNALGNAAWGYPEMFEYPAKNANVQMRGLNLSKQNDGTVIVNALLVFGVNPLEQESVEHGKTVAVEELEDIVSYMKDHLIGFSQASLYDYGETLYIREGVRIVGEETLTGEDVFTHHNYWNKVAYGSYPMDLQASYKGGYGNNLSGRSVYSIPFGVMIPKDIENLLVASRSSSFDILAHGSSRTVPVLMALGQAAGVASQYAIEHNVSFVEINSDEAHIKAIQKGLKKQKVDFNVYFPGNKEEKLWAYPYLVRIRKHGFVSGGVKTRFYLDKPASPQSLAVTVSLIKQHSKIEIPTITMKELPEKMDSESYLKVINKLLGTSFVTWEQIKDAGVIDDTVYQRMITTDKYTNGHSYALLAEVTKVLAHQQGIDLNLDPIHKDEKHAVLE